MIKNIFSLRKKQGYFQFQVLRHETHEILMGGDGEFSIRDFYLCILNLENGNGNLMNTICHYCLYALKI